MHFAHLKDLFFLGSVSGLTEKPRMLQEQKRQPKRE
jgi:hypothetical protein